MKRLKRLAALVGSCSIAFFPIVGAAQTSPFSDAVRAGDTLYLSGNIGRIPEGKDRHGEGLDEAARAAMDGLGRVLARHGVTFDDVVKCTVMLADIQDWMRFNETYRGYFHADRMPARSAFGGVQLAYDAALEIDCIADLSRTVPR